MRLYELVPTDGKDVVVYNEGTGHTQVLTPEGAVFNTEDTRELLNISIAFGVLTTSPLWRLATEQEIEEMRKHPPIPMLELSWTVPPPKPRPKLTVVKKET